LLHLKSLEKLVDTQYKGIRDQYEAVRNQYEALQHQQEAQYKGVLAAVGEIKALIGGSCAQFEQRVPWTALSFSCDWGSAYSSFLSLQRRRHMFRFTPWLLQRSDVREGPALGVRARCNRPLENNGKEEWRDALGGTVCSRI
jgi:hypothetical protein